MRCALFAVLALVSSCVRSESTTCGTAICPADSTCVTYTPLGTAFCMPSSDTRCRGIADGILCDDGKGTCYGGGCFPVGCGNGRIDDPVYARAEACDDANRRSHDGCSSSCTLEDPMWSLVVFAPPGRNCGAAMAYDSAQEVAVEFGGNGYGSPNNQTWIRTPSRWELRDAGFAPQPRFQHAVAFDSRRQEIVLFGGATGMSPTNRDTWTFDGVRWMLRTPADAPPSRAAHAMAYDPIRDRVLLFGGHPSVVNFPLDDTWSWDGTTWTKLAASGPTAMDEHAMAFDPVHGEIILVGEPVPGSVETWRFRDDAWMKVTGPMPPAARDVSLAFDPTTQRLLLVAPGPQQWSWDGTRWSGVTLAGPTGRACTAASTLGSGALVHGGTPQLGETAVASVSSAWIWNATGWALDVRTLPPTPRSGAVYAFDSARGRLVMFGGSTTAPTVETWELGPEGWTLALPLGGVRPPIMFNPTMVYDETHRRSVLIAPSGETWLWDGATWTLASSNAPTTLGYSVAFDPALGVLVFGGGTGMLRSNRMFVWDGTSWSELTGTMPEARLGHAMAYDPVAKKVLLYGGDGRGSREDTWEWDSATRAWTQLSPPSVPGPRLGHSLVWNAARQRLVLNGGGSATNSAWEWDRELATWRPVFATGLAGGGAAVEAPDGNGILVQITSGTLHGFTRLTWVGTGPLEGCGRIDADHDGLRGCEDPDCASVCRDAQRTCGNGSCEVTESCVLCPVDCGACSDVCGDTVCGADETVASCPGDCER